MMNWSDIFSYYYGWEIPKYVKSSIKLLVFVMIAIIVIQIILAIKAKTKGKKVLIWLSISGLIITTIAVSIIALKTANREAFLYHVMFTEASQWGKPLYGTGTSISNFNFTYGIYRLMAFVVAISYFLILISIKSKKIPGKVISGLFCGILLAGGIVLGIVLQKENAQNNKEVENFYIVDESNLEENLDS